MKTDIKPPDLEWKGDTPYSKTYGDIYFSEGRGPGESRFVYLEKSGYVSYIEKNPEDSVIVGEIGFGSGLNFILAWKEFCEKSRGHLYYVSVEKHPLSKDELKRVYSHFPDLQPNFDILLRYYPDRYTGFFRLNLDQNVTLTLLFGDALEALDELVLPDNRKVCFWFLDGFNPSQNRSIWNEELYRKMASFSMPGTGLSTFTSAGHVRRGLTNAGFEVSKIKGYGFKKEMITAVYQKEKNDMVSPWFYSIPRVKKTAQKSIAVIGAGLGGCALSESFARRGWSVSLFEKNSAPAQEASGNPRGIFVPILHVDATSISQLSLEAFSYALNHIKNLDNHGFITRCNYEGILKVLTPVREHQKNKKDDMEKARKASERFLDPLFTILTPEEASEICHVKIRYPCAYFPRAASLSPQDFCKASLAKAKNSLNEFYNTRVSKLINEDDRWIAVDEKGKEYGSFDAVVLANSYAALNFDQTSSLPLNKFRGQLFLASADDVTKKIKVPVSGDAYIIPEEKNYNVVGATHDHIEEDFPIPGQNVELYRKLQDMILSLRDRGESLKNETSRVAYRCAAIDHRPVIGPLPDEDAYKKAFSSLKDGEFHTEVKFRKAPSNPWHPNLYILGALGSRGILYSLMGAEIIASYVCEEPFPVEKSVLEAVHPARFLFRALKRQKSKL